MNDRFWTRDYWLGDVDARPLALFRISFGILLLQDLVMRFRDVPAFYTDGGILPRGQSERWAWSLFNLVGSSTAVYVLLSFGVLVTVAFILGWRTRVMTALCWLFTLSLQNRNLFVTDGGDDIARLFLFWSIFTNLGAAFSLDARRVGRVAMAPALGARLIQWQVAACYLGAGYFKLRGGWAHGNAIYQMLQLTGFVRPGGVWLLAHPGLCRIASLSTLFIELALPILLLTPIRAAPARAVGILLSTGLQLGIFLTMRVGMFQGALIVAGAMFLRPAWLDRIGVRDGGTSPSRTRWSLPWAVVLVGHLALAFKAETLGAPAIVDLELKWVGLNQGFDLFSRPIPVAHWRASGRLVDGREVDVLAVAQPELQPDVGFIFSRWTKFMYRKEIHFDALGDHLCRSFVTRGGGNLASLTLTRDVRPPRLPDEPEAPTRRETLVEHRCQ